MKATWMALAGGLLCSGCERDRSGPARGEDRARERRVSPPPVSPSEKPGGRTPSKESAGIERDPAGALQSLLAEKDAYSKSAWDGRMLLFLTLDGIPLEVREHAYQEMSESRRSDYAAWFFKHLAAERNPEDCIAFYRELPYGSQASRAAVWWAVHPGDSVPGSVPARGPWAAKPPTPSTGPLAPDSEMVKRNSRYRALMNGGVWTRECRGDFFQYVIDHEGLEAAWAFLDKAPDGEDRKEARRYLFQAWFCHDPAAVVAWIGDSKRSPAEQGFALAALTESMYYNGSGGLRAPDLRVAFEALASIPDRIKYSRHMAEEAKSKLLADFVKTNDVSSLLGYLKESGLEKDIPLALRVRAGRAPDDVIDYFDQRNEKMPDLIATSVAGGKAWDDPEAAVDFVQNHQWEDGSSMRASVESVMRAYLTRDSMAASQKVGELPPGKVKDLCIMEMAGWLRLQGSAHDIANWLPAITNPATRKRAEELMNAPKER